ncbi:MAG: cytochrome c [Acidobacteria bacterium]|nr:cytochrome c [Acidobacteriota bacterium]
MKRMLTAGCVGLVLAWASVSGLATESAAAAATAEGALAGLQETTSTVLDGVFTAAQARRGRRVYTQNCESCHGPELKGGEMAPSIAGSDFIVFWTELPVGTLFERIRVSMPEDGPGRLTDEEYTDVVAYLLDANDYPAGETELPADKTALDMILIVAAE